MGGTGGGRGEGWVGLGEVGVKDGCGGGVKDGWGVR